MRAINHVLTGIAIGLTLRPAVALPAALLSHFVLDAIPHYGGHAHTSKFFIRLLIVDAILAAIILVWLLVVLPSHWILAVICGIVAASPDLMWLPGWLRELRKQHSPVPNLVLRFHKNIQWAERPKNYPYEIAWAIGCLLLIIPQL